jgi:hypothetical protein
MLCSLIIEYCRSGWNYMYGIRSRETNFYISCCGNLIAHVEPLLMLNCRCFSRSHTKQEIMIHWLPVWVTRKLTSWNGLLHLFWYFAGRASQYIYLNINQLDALNFVMSLFHASTCFEHMYSLSGGQNCTMQPLVSSHWNKWVV